MSEGDQTLATPPTADVLEDAGATARVEPTSLEGRVEPTPPIADPPIASEQAPAGPRMIRRVVCGYELGWLPGEWLQAWRRLDRVLAEAGLRVQATLAPLEDLPSDIDILIVPPELREAAREAAPPGTPLLITPASVAAGAFGELLTRLQAARDFTAERVDDPPNGGNELSSLS